MRTAPMIGVLILACAESSPDAAPDYAAVPAASETTAVDTPPVLPGPDPTSRDSAATADRPAAAARPSTRTSTDSGSTRDARGRDSVESAPEVQDGAEILRRASRAYEELRSIRAAFTMIVENPLLRSTTTSSGTLYQRSPDRIKLEFSDPAGDLIVGDGTYFWVYYPSADAQQVIRAPAAQAGSGGVDLRAQFVGNPLERFTYTLHGRESVEGRPADVLTLVPKTDMGYRQLKVWIDARDGMARKFQIVEHNGLARTIQLASLEVNPALPDTLFRFTPPPGARIVSR